MLLAILVSCKNGYAKESEIDDFLEMSIEDLMNIEIITSTKSASTVDKAPSVYPFRTSWTTLAHLLREGITR